MTEENVVALKWLIASLESRIIDLMAGKLDESLEDLAKHPIPVEYRSLCQELKCIIPNLPTLSEHQNASIIPALLKDATGNEACSDSEPIELPAHTTTRSNENLKALGTPDGFSKNAVLPILNEAIIASRASPTFEVTMGRKRKSSIGENDDDKEQLLNAKIAGLNSLIGNSTTVKNGGNSADLLIESATKVPTANKNIAEKVPTSSFSTPATLMSPGRASTRSSRGSIAHSDEELSSSVFEIAGVISNSTGKNTAKDKTEEEDNQPSRRSRRTKS